MNRTYQVQNSNNITKMIILLSRYDYEIRLVSILAETM
jgi:hypothetical protein